LTPTKMRELKVLCQTEGAQSIKTLVAIRDSPRAGGMARLKAIEILLERGFGKPVQSITHRIIRRVAAPRGHTET
jgi:hypothetical protein